MSDLASEVLAEEASAAAAEGGSEEAADERSERGSGQAGGATRSSSRTSSFSEDSEYQQLRTVAWEILEARGAARLARSSPPCDDVETDEGYISYDEYVK